MKGYIRKRGANYQVEIFLGYSSTGKKRRHLKTLSNKRSAERYMREKITELETSGKIRVHTSETLEEYLVRWLDTVAATRVKPRTLEDYRQKLERHVFGTPPAQLPLPQLDPEDIQEIYNATLQRAKDAGGEGIVSVHRVHAVLRTALNTAVKRRLINANPTAGTDLPKKQKKMTRRIIEPQEIPAFVTAALEEERLGAMWVLAVLTAMRPGELLGLRWPDFSAELTEVFVQRTLVRPHRKGDGPAWTFETPKTALSTRKLSIGHQMAEVLRRHRVQQAEEKLAAGQCYSDHGLVFCNELGNPLHQHNLSQRVLPRILERAGLSSEITPYALRHSAATAMLASENVKVVSEILGHSGIAVTGDVYLQALRDSHERTAVAMGSLAFPDQLAVTRPSEAQKGLLIRLPQK